MKKAVFILAILLVSVTSAQTNLLNTSWTEGTGNITDFTVYGPSIENSRVQGVDGWGNSSVVWLSTPDISTPQDGGYYSSYKTIDPTETYRLTTWVKKTGSTAGRTFFGLHSRSGSTQSTQTLAGAVNSNPYFWSGDLPQLDKWYFIVGFIHPNNYAGASQGAMYDGATGEVVPGVNVVDFKFSADATQLRNRALLWKTTDTNDRQYYWEPSIYEVNASMPTIEDLTNTGGSTGGGDTVWNVSGSDINFIAGKVGIGTDNPDQALTVNGIIHTKEVRVDVQGPFVPDYVFYEDYNLKTLEEVQNFINEHGHLPNIPSAQQMEKEGMNLKEMNLKLLEKVEELTLYILDQEKRSLEQEERIKVLEESQTTKN